MSALGIFLLVEDEQNDIELIRRAFLKAKILNPLFVVKSGEEAIAYLEGDGKFARREEFPIPALVLLDLRMPGIDGFDVLHWIRRQPRLALLRVVVLTGSQDVRDIDTAYKAGANSFLVKPTDFDRFVEVSQALGGYWGWSPDPPVITTPPPAPISIARQIVPAELVPVLPATGPDGVTPGRLSP